MTTLLLSTALMESIRWAADAGRDGNFYGTTQLGGTAVVMGRCSK